MKIASRWFKSLLNHFLTHSAACASCYLNWFLFDCFCSHQWAEAFLSYDHYISRFFFFGSGSHLSSHTVASIVLSAVLVLTVVFGMGTGVSPKRIATGSFLLLGSCSRSFPHRNRLTSLATRSRSYTNFVSCLHIWASSYAYICQNFCTHFDN